MTVALWLVLDDKRALFEALCDCALDRDWLSDDAAESVVEPIAEPVADGVSEAVCDVSAEAVFIREIDDAALMDARGLDDADAEPDSLGLMEGPCDNDGSDVDTADTREDALSEDGALKLATADFVGDGRLDSDMLR